MNQYPVPRPDVVPLEDWESMDRSAQIFWWTTHNRQEPIHPFKLIEYYYSGHLTDLDFVSRIIEALSTENVASVIEACPQELLGHIIQETVRLPADDDEDGWSQTFSIIGATYHYWLTLEEIRELGKERDRKSKETTRNGIKVLRTYVQSKPELRLQSGTPKPKENDEF